MANGWVFRLIVLNGKAPWEKVISADFDDVLFGVKFFEVVNDGTIGGHLLTRKEFARVGGGA
jgi:hypothetical protein